MPRCTATGFKYPAPAELKKLDIAPTDETKQILGHTCRKYTYTYKKVVGEVWHANAVSMPNDIGLFRTSRMTAVHNTLSVPGFVLEMTAEDDKGGKTLMKTVLLDRDEKYVVDLKGLDIGTSINKVNYFGF